jgi:hypothetical protein
MLKIAEIKAIIQANEKRSPSIELLFIKPKT